MISFLDDIERICPGLWGKFCAETRADVRLWADKLEGRVPSLDRDWRKLVFKLLDYYLVTRGLSPPSYQLDGERLDVIVHPFKIYYGQVFYNASAEKGKLYEQISQSTCCSANFSGKWPWSADKICDALSMEDDLDKEARPYFDDHEHDLTKEQKANWEDFGEMVYTADVNDLGRLIFTAMNSTVRPTILGHNGLPHIFSTIQRITDSDVQNKDVLRKIIYQIVNECCVLPECLKISNITRLTENGDGPFSTGGGFADIYVGMYQDVKVVLKKLRKINTKNPYTRKELLSLFQEAILWRQLHHENILIFYGINDTLFDAGSVVLVSPFIKLGDLSEFSRLEKRNKFNGVDFMMQIARGLEYLHSREPQIIHGDLRGSNILVDDEYGDLHLLIADFGISKIEQIYTKSSSYTAKGARRWMAPEIQDPPEGYSGRPTEKSDVYAYAMTCVEIFSGDKPFPESREAAAIYSAVVKQARPKRPSAFPVAENRGLDDHIWSIVETCWQHDDSQRPHIRDVLQELERYTGLDDTIINSSSSSTKEISMSPT